MYRQNGLLLEPTTRDDIAQFGDTVGYLEVTKDGVMLLALPEPVEIRHKEEETVMVPPGLYKLKGDGPWGGAPLTGIME